MLSPAQASVLEAKYEKLKEEGKVRFDRLKEQSNHRKAELAEARQQVRFLRRWGCVCNAGHLCVDSFQWRHSAGLNSNYRFGIVFSSCAHMALEDGMLCVLSACS